MEQSQAASVQANEYRNVPVAQLQESPTNPRKRFNEESLNELAASFKSQGVLAPLVVRPIPAASSEAEQFEVVARRSAAASGCTVGGTGDRAGASGRVDRCGSHRDASRRKSPA